MNERYTIYERQTARALQRWEKELLKAPGMLERTSRSVQHRVNRVIPEKVHEAITVSVKSIVQTALFTMEYMPKGKPLTGLSLAARDQRAEELLSLYKKVAAAEGAGTGAGGLLLGLADFPILIGIKMKFLFELAHVYGFSTLDYRERLYILYVFQLAFCSQVKKHGQFRILADWPQLARQLPPAEAFATQINWRQLQQEYRDTIDFRKMLQLVPGIGAIIGAWANYGLLEELGQTAMHAYRLRWLQQKDIDG
ncbi:EcsC family protein [Paenibacillus sp. YYML68]|uniref:EcsC family protein n=1 Tax=Paenibacillus sp. YYML68 TaxID=2909250 RepID=UPI002490982D|nr:EcsC family protein [Paenibacillus sp. YYML68]